MILTDDHSFQGTYQGIRFEAQATFTLLSPPLRPAFAHRTRTRHLRRSDPLLGSTTR